MKGKTLGIDATTMEANAAMKSIVRRDTGEGYDSFLESLAKESGIETPTRADLARIDKKRKNKASNDDWQNPHDPDAEITKMKDGRTHLAHKVEHAVDMDTGAVMAVTIQPGAKGDTKSLPETLSVAFENTAKLLQDPSAATNLSDRPVTEVVGDKGYHSNDTMVLTAGAGIRSYISEPERGRRQWEGKQNAQDATYGNRRRMKGERGKALMRRRGEMLERTFAHTLESGAMRRACLRLRDNILKRYLVHVAGFNLSLVMRAIFGVGTPRARPARSRPRSLRRGSPAPSRRRVPPARGTRPTTPAYSGPAIGHLRSGFRNGLLEPRRPATSRNGNRSLSVFLLPPPFRAQIHGRSASEPGHGSSQAPFQPRPEKSQ